MLFSEDEIVRFHFIDDQHPATFALHKGSFKGIPVAALLWVDEERNQIRPWAIILNDANMQYLKLEGVELVKDDDSYSEELELE